MFGRRIEIDEPSQLTAVTVGQTILRIVVGVVLAAHGLQKLMGYGAWRAQVAELGIPMPDIAAPLAIAGELLGGLGLAFGLFTRTAALGAFCVMAVAIATVHLDKGLFAQSGGFEYPLTLAAATIFFLTAGPGPVSLSTHLRRRARHRRIQRDEIWSRPPYTPVPEHGPYGEVHGRDQAPIPESGRYAEREYERRGPSSRH